MEEDSFYLTLLSNSSMIYYPNNKTTNFCTQLPKTIHLEGEWLVALMEFQYPCSLLSVRKKQNIIYLEERTTDPEKTIKLKLRLETGNYDNVDDLLLALNTDTHLISKGVTFILNKASQRISASFETDSPVISLRFSICLSLQLGFEPDEDVFSNRHGKHPANVILGLPSQFFIYCDILEPQIVGDTNAKLLRVVSADNSKYMYGAQKMKIFSPPHYIPVLKRGFENIEIDIRTETGESVPFSFGTVCVKLHFKRKST